MNFLLKKVNRSVTINTVMLLENQGYESRMPVSLEKFIFFTILHVNIICIFFSITLSSIILKWNDLLDQLDATIMIY